VFSFPLAAGVESRMLEPWHGEELYALVDHAFRDLGVERVEIFAEPRNTRSRAVPERLGFRREGTLRHVAKLNNRFVDHVVYALLREEWKALKKE